MRISEMTNDQATEAMIRLTGPFNNICEDEELLDFFDKVKAAQDEDTPMVRVVGRLIPQLVTLALKKHRADLYEIIGALTMTPLGKVGAMNFKETINAVRDSYDEILKDFFTSSVSATHKAGNASADV